MKEYYFVENGEKKGPLSFEELRGKAISKDTLIWEDSFEDWKKAMEVPELAELIKKTPPPIPKKKTPPPIPITKKNPPPVPENVSIKNEDKPAQKKSKLTTSPLNHSHEEKKRYDYSQIEDIAKVDYRNAMIITGIYIALHLYPFSMHSEVLRFLWILSTTILAAVIWNYFSKYFESLNDSATAKWIKWVIGAFVLFGVLNLFMSSNSSFEELGDFNDIEDNLLRFALFAPIIIVIVSGFKVISVNSKHTFPLKRIAISTMVVVPIYMFYSIFFNIELIRNSGDFQVSNLFAYAIGNALLVLPFFFLLHHFYRADIDDRTPN